MAGLSLVAHKPFPALFRSLVFSQIEKSISSCMYQSFFQASPEYTIVSGFKLFCFMHEN